MLLRTAVIVTTVRLGFYGRSTAYQGLLRSRWRNASVAADPPAAVTLTCWFIYASVQQLTHW